MLLKLLSLHAYDGFNINYSFIQKCHVIAICMQMFFLIQQQSELDIGSWYVTYLPTHPELSVLLLFKLDHLCGWIN